jgi:glycosyltransferase involved in cell wall biosynthesis
VISAVILTYNEESDLPACLGSLTWCDDVRVVDSGSTDATVSLAKERGALVYVNRFTSFGQQRNWALDHAAENCDWVLFLDADEVATPEFRTAVQNAIAHASAETAGFYCCWKMMLGERWLRRCDAFPKWQFRLVRVGRARFTDFGHGQKEGEVNGGIGYIREPYLHYAFSKGWSYWLDRHNRYSTQEARARLEAPVHWRMLLKARGSQRNKLLKPLVSRIPGWPLIRFGLDYFGRMGFLEGREGLIYCINVAYYEFLIILKMAELTAKPMADDSGP